MTSIKEIAAALALGARLEDVAEPGADLDYLRRAVNRYTANKVTAAPKRKQGKSNRSVSRPRQSRRRLSAAEGLAKVIAGATCEMLDRVNGKGTPDDRAIS